MEIELKYLIDEEEKVEQIFQDEYVQKLRDSKEENTIPMSAVYYDTENRVLTERTIAFRIRQEAGQYVATLKWDGGSEDGMHRREEINIPLGAEPSEPSVDMFAQSDIWEELSALVGDQKLVPLMSMDFLRREIRLDDGETICMLSVDEGEIVAGDKKAPIMELEIELYSGSEEHLKEIGTKISEKYELKPEDNSKFQRGYGLIS